MIRDGICLSTEELELLLGNDWNYKLKNVRKEMDRKEHLLKTLNQGDMIYYRKEKVTVLGIDYIEGIIKARSENPRSEKSYLALNPLDIQTIHERFLGNNIYTFDTPAIVRLKDEDMKSVILFLESKYGIIQITQLNNVTRLHWNLDSFNSQLTIEDKKIITEYLGKTIVEIKAIEFVNKNKIKTIIQHIIVNYENSKI